jgi:hypothetical protein
MMMILPPRHFSFCIELLLHLTFDLQKSMKIESPPLVKRAERHWLSRPKRAL